MTDRRPGITPLFRGTRPLFRGTRPFGTYRLLGLVLLVVPTWPAVGSAQDYPPYPDSYGGGTRLYSGPRREVYAFAGPGFGSGWFGTGYWYSGFPYGPRVAPPWSFPGLSGGPFIGYPGGFPGFYSARAGSSWSNGLSLYGPPVPTYGPIPGVMGNQDLRRLWHDVPSPGIPFGWVGLYAASPRPRGLSVSVWPVAVEGIGPVRGSSSPAPDPSNPGASKPGGCLILSVKVPQPAAEVFVDGVKTAQTGTERLFESPVLPAGQEFRYEVTARWVERGVVHERKKIVSGTPGEVVRLDFTTPEVVPTGK